MKILVYVCLITAFFCRATTVLAENSVELMVNAVDMDYEEVDSDGDFLDSDTGVFPGYQLAFVYSGPSLYSELRGGWNEADLDYQSVIGDSEVGEQVVKTEFLLGTNIQLKEAVSFSPYVLWGFRDWKRDIRSNDSFFGLDEDYSWRYLGLGTELVWQLNGRSEVSVSTAFAKSYEADLEVTFLSQNFDTATLDLPDGEYLLLELGYGFQLSENLVWHSSLQADEWKFARSESFPLSVDGLITNSTVAEPKNRTFNLGFATGLRFNF